MLKVTEIKVNDYLTKSNLPASDFVINPYVGCLHGGVAQRYDRRAQDTRGTYKIEMSSGEYVSDYAWKVFGKPKSDCYK